MVTYGVLNVLFILLVCLIMHIKPKKPGRAFVVTLGILLVLTAIFDNAIVGLSIVDYNPGKILGIKIGVAPIEDFMYALLAVVLVPATWRKMKDTHAK